MAATPPEIVQYLQQLELILIRWYQRGELGEVATIFGINELQAEERPRRVTAKVRLKQRTFVGTRVTDRAT